MADKFKSIFRRKEFEKIYYVGIVDYMSFEPHCAFMTKGVTDKLSSYNKRVELSDKEIGRYDIEIPLLEVGEEFFLHDIQQLVKIKSRFRSSDGTVVYYVDDTVIETENTQKSKDIADRQIENWNHNEERFKKLEKDFEDYKKEYKYKNRFFNKRLKD